MSSHWYCTDCETAIDADEIDEHEADDHTVKGRVRPDRLLGNDPWNVRIEVDGTVESEPDVSTDRGGER